MELRVNEPGLFIEELVFQIRPELVKRYVELEYEIMAKELAVLEDRLIYMQLRLDAPITDEYIRRIAREKLNYRDPDEILFYNDLAD